MLKKILSLTIRNFSQQSKFITSRDLYQSLYINLKQQKIPHYQFKQQLIKYQIQQKNKNSNAIWIFLNSVNLQHTSYLINEMSYKIHHGKQNKITLYKWLSEKTDLVPEYSSFYVSCGAIIINNDHLLMVQESNGPRKGKYGIPGGRSDVGEFLHKTAQRQLFEQTGIKSQFQYFIYMRQMQNTVFGANDIYFACKMRTTQQNIKKLKLCDRELSSYKWIHLLKLNQFCKEYTFGTQQQLGIYLNQLYNSGYNFNEKDQKKFPNKIKQSIFTKSQDKIIRKFYQHQLISKQNL